MKKMADIMMANEGVNYIASFNKNVYIKDFLLMPLVVGFFTFFFHWIQFKTTELLVTPKRLMMKAGVIAYKTVEIPLERITSTSIECTIMGRIFNYGKVFVNTRDNDNMVFVVNEPMVFKQALDSAVAEAKEWGWRI